MNRIARFTLTAAMFTGIGLAQSGAVWSEQWIAAKYGRSPKADRAPQTAGPAVLVPPSANAELTWTDEWFRAKHGRYSPAEQARRNEELASTAFRELPTTATGRSEWINGYLNAKHGRAPLPR